MSRSPRALCLVIVVVLGGCASDDAAPTADSTNHGAARSGQPPAAEPEVAARRGVTPPALTDERPGPDDAGAMAAMATPDAGPAPADILPTAAAPETARDAAPDAGLVPVVGAVRDAGLLPSPACLGKAVGTSCAPSICEGKSVVEHRCGATGLCTAVATKCEEGCRSGRCQREEDDDD